MSKRRTHKTKFVQIGRQLRET